MAYWVAERAAAPRATSIASSFSRANAAPDGFVTTYVIYEAPS